MPRIVVVLLSAVAMFGFVAPSAEAATPSQLESNLAALWTKVLETPAAQNSYGSGGAAFGCWDLGGTVAPSGPSSIPSCTVKPGTKIFVTGSSAECSTFANDCGAASATYDQLRGYALQADTALAGDAPKIKLDGADVQTTEVYTGLLNVVLPDSNVLGDPAGTRGQSVAHGWVALLHPLTPGTHTIAVKSQKLNYTTQIVVSRVDRTDNRQR